MLCTMNTQTGLILDKYTCSCIRPNFSKYNYSTVWFSMSIRVCARYCFQLQLSMDQFEQPADAAQVWATYPITVLMSTETWCKDEWQCSTLNRIEFCSHVHFWTHLPWELKEETWRHMLSMLQLDLWYHWFALRLRLYDWFGESRHTCYRLTWPSSIDDGSWDLLLVLLKVPKSGSLSLCEAGLLSAATLLLAAEAAASFSCKVQSYQYQVFHYFFKHIVLNSLLRVSRKRWYMSLVTVWDLILYAMLVDYLDELLASKFYTASAYLWIPNYASHCHRDASKLLCRHIITKEQATAHQNNNSLHMSDHLQEANLL